MTDGHRSRGHGLAGALVITGCRPAAKLAARCLGDVEAGWRRRPARRAATQSPLIGSSSASVCSPKTQRIDVPMATFSPGSITAEAMLGLAVGAAGVSAVVAVDVVAVIAFIHPRLDDPVAARRDAADRHVRVNVVAVIAGSRSRAPPVAADRHGAAVRAGVRVDVVAVVAGFDANLDNPVTASG